MAYRRTKNRTWYRNPGELIQFTRGASEAYPDLKPSPSMHGLTFTATIPVTGYDSRTVRIFFSAKSPAGFPRVLVDGPTASPHRYEDGQPCIWYPEDPESARWVKEDGLLALLDLIAVHLFKEAWWRDTDQWLGPEAPHAVPELAGGLSQGRTG